MVPLQTLVGEAVGWLVLVLLVFGPGAVATLCWTPFLASKRVRALFAALPPFESLAVTYPVVGIAASLPYVLGVGAGLVLVEASGPEGGARLANAILDVVVPVSLGYVVLVPAVAIVGLPRLGVDWDPTGYGLSTWAILVAGGVWYAALFAAPLLFVAFFLALPL